MTDAPHPDPMAELLIEATSREDGKYSTVQVYPDRIEWLKQESISSRPRAKDDPPVIPLQAVASVKARNDGPLFSKVLLRTDFGPITFRMHTPVAIQVRDLITRLLAAGPPPYVERPRAQAKPAAETGGPSEDDLRQLEMLRADGMLSQAEFEEAKARLAST
jgi:hypothetical protein